MRPTAPGAFFRRCQRQGFISALLLLVLTGCSSVGPNSVARDRFDYTTSVADSWKRQMLLNIVKIRYGDAPIFLDVASITNQYSLETELTGTLGWSAPPSINSQGLSGTGRYTDRPTITYTPLEFFASGFAMALLAVVFGCAGSQPQQKFSGFLDDYPTMTKGAGDVDLRFLDPAVDWKKYDKIMMDEVVFFFKTDTEYHRCVQRNQ